MALPPVVSQILAEANRVYFECMKNNDVTDENSLSWKMTDSYQNFGLKLQTLFEELQSAIDNYISEIGGLTDSNMNPMYLHLQASVPRRSNSDWQLAIPNQTNQTFDKWCLQDKGRIHCLGLSGSYHFQNLHMKIKMYTSDFENTKDKILYTHPISFSGFPPVSSTIGSPFWHAYNFFSDISNTKNISHAVGKFYYFEKYGYTENSKKVQFLVKGETTGLFYSTAIAWESDSPHGGVSFGSGQ